MAGKSIGILFCSIMISSSGGNERQRISGTNFQVNYPTSFGSEKAKEIQETLNALQLQIPKIVPELEPSYDFQCEVILYEDRSQLMKSTGFNIGYGFYNYATKELNAVPEKPDKPFNEYHIILHEFTHFHLDRVYDLKKKAVPGWLNEGLACYFAGARFDDNWEIKSIKDSKERIEKVYDIIRRTKRFDIERILLSESRQTADYELSWSLCKFFIEDDGKYRMFFSTLLDCLKTSQYREALEKAASTHKVNYRELSAEWRRFYIREYKELKAVTKATDSPE